MIESSESVISQLLSAIGPEPRVKILLAIGVQEACVCHLEAALGYRQAYISQHLMALREARILTTRREGRYIYYRLREPALLGLIALAAQIAGVPFPERSSLPEVCGCPNCVAPIIPQ